MCTVPAEHAGIFDCATRRHSDPCFRHVYVHHTSEIKNAEERMLCALE